MLISNFLLYLNCYRHFRRTLNEDVFHLPLSITQYIVLSLRVGECLTYRYLQVVIDTDWPVCIFQQRMRDSIPPHVREYLVWSIGFYLDTF